MHRPVALNLHHRHDGRRIDAAGEERAQRNIGHHAEADDLAKQGIELVYRLSLRAPERVGEAVQDDLPRVPVAGEPRARVG